MLDAALLSPAAPLEDPTTLVAEENYSLAYGGGFLYWERDCAYSVDTEPVSIRRRAENGGAIHVLYEHTTPTYEQCASVSPRNVADDDGFFYVNYAYDRLDARLTDDPYTVVPLADLDHLSIVLATDEDYVYYNQSSGIYRAAKDGTGDDKINNATGVTGLAVDDTYIYWLDGTGLWRASKTCVTSSCWNDEVQFSDLGGKHLTLNREKNELIWVNHSNGYWSIKQRKLYLSGTGGIYFASDTEVYSLGQPVYHDGCYFWPENTLYDIIPPPNNLLRRMCAGPSSAETIAEGQLIRDRLYAGTLGLLFADGDGIYQLPFDAEAITKDFHLEAMEVTQSIQNLYNDVSLVADKPAYVRVFGTLTANHRADAVQVVLRGFRDGVELSSSPLSPIDGLRPMVPDADWDRSAADDSWIFQLPGGWVTSGDLHLEAEIDPRGVYDDPNFGDNTLSEDVTFIHRPPLCLVFMPVRTHAGRGSSNNPTFGPMVDLAERLLPVPEVHTFIQSEPVEELQVCWKWGFIPYPCWGPYELDEEGAWHEAWRDDENSVLDSIATRWAFSDDPDVCDDAGANTHYVGMVHHNSATMGGNTTGMGRIESYASWVKFSSPGESQSSTYPWTWPRPGGTLAHELGHNYNRYDPPTLAADTIYYWGIRATDGLSTTAGPVWSFRTAPSNYPPYTPYKPTPDDRATDVPTDQVLTWRSSDPERDPMTYDIALGTRNPPPVVSKNVTATVYDPGPLAEGTHYYWRITVTDGISTTVGSTWRFRTAGGAYVYLPLVLRH